MRAGSLTFLALGLVAVLLAAGCGGSKAAVGSLCSAQAPPALSAPPALPRGFPVVDSVIYTKNARVGSTTTVSGYLPGDVAEAFAAYKSAISGASGYTVTKSEQAGSDAVLDFAGGSKTGQVKLLQRCKGRTEVTITAG